VRVAVLDDYQQVAMDFARWDLLPDGVEVTVFHDHVDDEVRLVDRLRGYEIVVLMRERTPMSEAVLAALPNLRLLVTTGMANAAIDLDAAHRMGITVCGTAGSLTGTVELTWGLIIAVVRQLVREDRAVRRGGWQESVGRTLGGRTLGLAGLGRIGQRVARIAQAFDMRVLAWSTNLTDELAAGHGAHRVSKEELFSASDVVSVHLQLSPRSVGIIGEQELRCMKPTAYLVNTSRGPLVDEAALVAALQNGRIAGAGLDVFWEEPIPPDHPLLALQNTVLSPHLGYVTDANYNRYFPDAVEDIAAFLAGQPIRELHPSVSPRPMA
jgi:phosphoglycerate dehydrogenase-like enzyme